VADVYWYFKQWEQAKVTEVMLAALREQARVQQGRNPQPSAGIIDSQSVKGADTVGRDSRGYDAGKKINGRKRFIVTDTLGLLIVVVVLAASVQDRDGARTTLLSAYLEERPGSLGGIDKSIFYVKTHFCHERRRLPRPDRAG
jgi:transposase